MDTGHNSSSAHGRDPAKATEGHGASFFAESLRLRRPPPQKSRKRFPGRSREGAGSSFLFLPPRTRQRAGNIPPIRPPHPPGAQQPAAQRACFQEKCTAAAPPGSSLRGKQNFRGGPGTAQHLHILAALAGTGSGRTPFWQEGRTPFPTQHENAHAAA